MEDWIMRPKNEGKLALVGSDRTEGTPRQQPDVAPNEVAGALRDLPALPVPDALWLRVRDDFVARQRRAARRRWVAAACAASIVVAAVGWVGLGTRTPAPVADLEVQDVEQTVEELAAASRQLEEILQTPRLRAPVLTAAEAVAIVELEDRVTLVDEAISGLGRAGSRSPAEAREAVCLWSERVELLDALVEARGLPLSRGNIVYASTDWR